MAVSLGQFTLTAELAEVIRSLSSNGLKTLSTGAEIGGLIAAGPSASSPDYVVRLVPRDRKFDPVRSLSPEELLQLSNTAREIESEGRVVAAYFRSCTRSRLHLEPGDSDNIAFACPDVPFVVLAKPSRTGSAQICVFSRAAGGTWELAQSVGVGVPVASDFPAPPTDLTREPPLPLAANSSWDTKRDTRKDPDVAGKIAPPANRSREPRGLWILAMAAALIAVGWFLWIRFQPPNNAAAVASKVPFADLAVTSSPPAPSKLGFTVSEENGKLHASWDHNSPSARAAVFGSLEISDSDYSKNIGLSAADITGGSIVYTPHSGDVTLRLMFTGNGTGISEEMVRFVSGDSHTGDRSFRVAVPSAQTPGPATTNQVVEAPAPLTPQRFFPPTRITTAPVAERKPVIVEPPLLELPRISTPANLLSGPLPSQPTAPPSRTAAVPPVVSAGVMPPVPIRQVQPVKTGQAAWRLYAPVTISVTVSIDEHGRVTNALPTSPGAHANPFLASLCLTAARDWIFKPATRDGRPVPSEFGIDFRFHPDK